MTRPEPDVWPAYVRASIWLALLGGFVLGGILFLSLALRLPIGAWWVAAGQAHGHLQLFGWAGLMVLGVGFHFLPRLRGSPLAHPKATRLVLALLVGGMVVRLGLQPIATGGGPLATVLRAGVAASAALELAGASVALAILLLTHLGGPPLAERRGLRPVLPLFVIAFTSYWLALAANLVGLTLAAVDGTGLVPASVGRLSTHLGLYGFLALVSVAMAARTFPLYFETRLASAPLLRAGAALMVAGLLAQGAGDPLGWTAGMSLGRLLVAGALASFVVALGVFGRRRPLPGKAPRRQPDPLRLHALSAFGWLALAAALLLTSGLGALGIALPQVSPDVERHVVGTGFVSVLIMGIGARMLPGFANRPLRSGGLSWATLVLGNLAALLRVGPVVLAPVWSGLAPVWVLASAGLAGSAAIVAFWVSLPLDSTSTGAEHPAPSV